MEDNLRALLEAKRDNYKNALATVERWLDELTNLESQQFEMLPSGGEMRQQQQQQLPGEVAEHMLIGKSPFDAACAVLRAIGKPLDSREIVQHLVNGGYDFSGVSQPVKSIGKALRASANRGEMTFNETTGRYWFKP